MTNNLSEFPLRQSIRVQSLPLDLPPILVEIPMEAIDQRASANSHMEENPTMEVGEGFTTYDDPLVE